MSEDLRALAAVVQRLSGFVVRDGQLAYLDAALARVDPRLTPAALLRDPDLTRLERLVDEVAIKETFFLRHAEEMDDIDWTGEAARAAAARRPLRVWSVGCSTGEEAYSLALLAAEALGDARAPIDVLGTDLSRSALALAERGLYGTRSMRLVNRARRLRWFVADGEKLRVSAELGGLVRFARHNIVHDQSPPEGEALFDLVVCRNVLIYFDGPTAARATAALGDALAPGARLLLGTADRLGSPPVKAVAPEQRATSPVLVQTQSPKTRRLHRDAGTIESSEEAAHAAFDVGSRALSTGDAAAAIHALRRALYLDPRRAVVALQLARAHEALGHAEPARRAYWRALRLVDEVPDPGPRLYDRVAAGDVAAACRARLAALPNPDAVRGDA